MKKLIRCLSIFLVITVFTSCGTVETDGAKKAGGLRSDVFALTDLAFLVDMDLVLAEKFWDPSTVTVDTSDPQIPYQYAVSDAVKVYVGDHGVITRVRIDYTMLQDRSELSLMGINGLDTFDTIVEKFGKDFVYPHNWRGVYQKTIPEAEFKDMCSVVVCTISESYFVANFDEAGFMTSAGYGYPVN